MSISNPSLSPPRVAAAALAAALFLSFASTARAEEPLFGTSPLLDPRALGLAGALCATPSSASGLYLNPATIAMAPVYHISLGYQFAREQNANLHTAGGAIVDSITSSTIGAGLSLNYLRANESRRDFESWDARLAVAGNIKDTFFIGATGRYLRVESDLERGDRGPNGRPALPSSGSQQMDGLTFDAGAGLRLANIVSIGVAGYNLSNPGSAYAPLSLGSGVGVTLFEMLLIEADAVFDFTSHDEVGTEIRSAVELFLAGRVPLRVGYAYDVYYDINTIAAGIGYVDPSFGVDIGFQKDLTDGGRFALALGLRIFIG
ncbi:MAG: hypothetical protein M0R80_06900 [Proteobacteria bacterium]|jgi:hypothetical protein|nr:hypothetical protein [Pseudomonadota bacterium]